MEEIPPGARTEDDLERLLEEVAERLSQTELAGLLAELGAEAPQGLLPTYRLLRTTVLPGAPETGDALRRALAGRSAEAPVAPIFERAFFLFGLRRSGNHALCDWLAGHFAPEEVVYLNSADLAGYRNTGARFSVDFGKYRYLERAPDQRVLIIGYENIDPVLFPLARNARVARRAEALILLRDLPNMAASIARGAREMPAFAYRYRVRDFPDLWCRYARLHLAPPSPWRPVSYNSWVADAAYREALQDALGLPRSEVGRDRVSPYGGGSSFEGTAQDGEGSSMAVLARWEEMRDDPLFQFLILAEEEALALNAQLFPMEVPGRELWLRWWQRR